MPTLWKPEVLGEEADRRCQQGGVGGAGFQRREAARGIADHGDIVVAVFQSVGLHDALEIDAVDVDQAADADGLALEILHRGDGRLGHHLVSRHLADNAQEADRRAFFHGVDRFDHTDIGDDVEGACGQLLHQAGRGRHIDDVERNAGVGEEAFLDADIPGPADRIGGADHSGRDGLGGLGRWRPENEDAT